MSFRARLLVFFTIIVVIPMIAVALVLFSLTEDSEHGKVDARLASGLRTALSFYEGARDLDADSGDVTVNGEDFRARVQDVGEAVGPATLLHVLEDASAMSDAITESRLLIGGLMIAFLVLSLASSVFVVRALQGQIDNFLQAARKLGGGDLTERVPVQGDDEFAALGQEFNTMAGQLETHVAEVERKRHELEESIRRIGEAFGTGLDRQGLVDLAVRTAVQACDADAGRMVPVDPRELEEVRLVDDPALLKALE